MTNEIIISERCYNQDQSWYYERTAKFEAATQSVKLKVSIRRNAYDHQSHAQVYFWNGQQWNLLVDSPISECECKDIAYFNKGVKPSFFMADRNRLLVEALKICWA
jgi:hypothetical protein